MCTNIVDVSSIPSAAADRWLSDDEERAWRALQFMQMRLTSELAQQLATDGDLSYPDYLVLVALTDQPEGRARPFEVAAMLGWEKSRLSHHAARMSERGLVAKERCDSDGRGAELVVTSRGRTALAAAAPGHVAAVRRLFVDLVSPAELRTIERVATRVLAAADEQEHT